MKRCAIPTALNEHIYERLLGPRLSARQAALRESGEQLLGLWTATTEFSRWLTGLLKGALQTGRIQFDKSTRQWSGDQQFCLPEQVLTWDVCEPGWQAPVRVSGIADSLWKNPVTGRWCVVEYKLGRGARELDLAQVCLYHEMLAASGLADENGAVALVAFKPEREETFFPSAELKVVKEALRQLIGSLAGVSADARERRFRSGSERRSRFGWSKISGDLRAIWRACNVDGRSHCRAIVHSLWCDACRACQGERHS